MSINGINGFWVVDFYNEFGASKGDVSIMEFSNNCLEVISLLKAVEFNQPLGIEELIRRTKSIVKAYYLSGKSKDDKIDFATFATNKLQEIINVEHNFNNQVISVTELLEFYEEIVSIDGNVSFVELANYYNKTDNSFRVIYGNSLDIEELKQGVIAIIKAYYLSEKREDKKTEFSTFMETTIQQILRVQCMFEEHELREPRGKH